MAPKVTDVTKAATPDTVYNLARLAEMGLGAFPGLQETGQKVRVWRIEHGLREQLSRTKADALKTILEVNGGTVEELALRRSARKTYNLVSTLLKTSNLLEAADGLVESTGALDEDIAGRFLGAIENAQSDFMQDRWAQLLANDLVDPEGERACRKSIGNAVLADSPLHVQGYQPPNFTLLDKTQTKRLMEIGF